MGKLKSSSLEASLLGQLPEYFNAKKRSNVSSCGMELEWPLVGSLNNIAS